MAKDDPQQALRDLYADGLRECGFDQTAIERGLAMLESDRYSGFSDVVVSLQISGSSHAGSRDHAVEAVVRRVAAQEGLAAIARNGAQAASRVAARRAEEAADRDDALRRAHGRVQELEALLGEMTPAELDGRAPLRPHIAEALREQTGHSGEFQVGPSSRPSWAGRAPGPKIREAGQTAEPSTSADPPALVESLQELGLSEEAAKRAATGR